jgi:hypothetical protein
LNVKISSYADGDFEPRVPRIRVRRLGHTEPRNLAAGTLCEARAISGMSGHTRCLPGVVVCAEAPAGRNYLIQFQDG